MRRDDVGAADILNAAYEEMSGIVGPTPRTSLDAFRARFPDLNEDDLRRALERAYELKSMTCTLADDLENGRCASEEKALQALVEEFPGFSDATYRRALRDGWTINRW